MLQGFPSPCVIWRLYDHYRGCTRTWSVRPARSSMVYCSFKSHVVPQIALDTRSAGTDVFAGSRSSRPWCWGADCLITRSHWCRRHVQPHLKSSIAVSSVIVTLLRGLDRLMQNPDPPCLSCRRILPRCRSKPPAPDTRNWTALLRYSLELEWQFHHDL